MTWYEWVAFGILVLGFVGGVLWWARNLERSKDAKVLKVKEQILEAIRELRDEHEEWLDRIGKQIDKHDHTLYGPDGKNGLKSDVADQEAWRFGKGVYGPHDLETRCRHTAKNLDQELMDKLTGEIERRKFPRRDHS